MGFLRSGAQDMLDSCLDSGWMSTTLFASNAPSLPPWNSIHTLYQDQTKERVNFYNNRNGNMHLSSCHKREGERERESTCVWLPNLCTFFFSNTRSKFLSQNTQIQWRRAKDPQANKILKEKERQRGGSQKAHRFFTRLFFFLIIFCYIEEHYSSAGS